MISGSRATKSQRGRPVAAETRRLRDAILDLTDAYDVMTVRADMFYALLPRVV